MEVTTANHGNSQLIPASTTTTTTTNMVSSQQDNNNKQQYHLVNNKNISNNSNSITNNSFTDETINLNNNSINNNINDSNTTKTIANFMINCEPLQDTSSRHVNLNLTIARSQHENPTNDNIGECSTNKNPLPNDHDDFEVITEVMRELFSKIEVDSVKEDHQQSSSEKSIISKEKCAVPENALRSRKEETVNESKQAEQLDSSPDEGTCDLIIDSEALQAPTSNESQLEAPDPVPVSIKLSQPNKEQELNLQCSNMDSEDLKESHDLILGTTTTTSSASLITDPLIEATENANTTDSTPSQDLVTQKFQESLDDTEKIMQSSGDAKQDTTKVNDPVPEITDTITNEKEELMELDCLVSENKIEQEEFEEKTKDMVILRNLEITPPPLPSSSEDGPSIMDSVKNEDKANEITEASGRKKKRTSADSAQASDEYQNDEGAGRSKRQRTKTQLFQAGEVKMSDESYSSRSSRTKPTRSSSIRSRKKSTTSDTTSDTNISNTHDSTTTDLHLAEVQDVICYEKNDYLAIRNEENTFYLCQLAENVRLQRPFIKIKWLDTKDEGKTYFLTSHYDKVPQKSIIMPVNLIKSNEAKKSEQIFTIAENEKDIIMARLKRSLSAASELANQ